MYQNLHAGMGQAVFDHLSQFANLDGLVEKNKSTEGFIAGQAVASALSELFYSGFAVSYNDVDAFLMGHEFADNKRKALATLTSKELVRVQEYGQLVLEVDSVYTVCSTKRQGMLNEVLCQTGYRAEYQSSSRMAQAFLRSFDLNCVQVAVRLSDKQLVWTPAFETFLVNQELLVMNPKTPVHTAIRWFRKKAELEGVYGHDDKTMELLASAAGRIRLRQQEGPDAWVGLQRTWNAQLMFGKLYTAKAVSVMGDLSRYFDMEKVPDRYLDLNTLVSRGCENTELVQADMFDMLLPTYARALQGHWRKHTCKQVIEALKAPYETLSRMNVSVEGVQAVLVAKNASTLAQLNKFYGEHSGLGRIIVNMNTERQLVFMDALKDLSRKEGLWAIGVFEQLDADPAFELSTVELEALPARVQTLFAAEIAHYEELTREVGSTLKTLAPMEFEGFRLSEIICFKELLQEGVRMHHCVGGYFGSIMSGSSRIIRMQRHRVEDSLTMELTKHQKGWHLRQVRGLVNRPATPVEQAVADKLTTLVNMQCAFGLVKVKPSLALLVKLEQKVPTAAAWLEELVTTGWGTRRARFDQAKRKFKQSVKDTFQRPEPAPQTMRAFCGADGDEDIPF